MGNIFARLLNLFSREDELIYRLKKEHQELFRLYTQISLKVDKKDFNEVFYLLETFHLRYKKHILLEDNYFYAKLLRKYKDYDNIIDFISLTKDELNDITHSLERFLHIYNSSLIIEDKFKEFKHDFDALGDKLKERVDFEEHRLYVLY